MLCLLNSMSGIALCFLASVVHCCLWCETFRSHTWNLWLLILHLLWNSSSLSMASRQWLWKLRGALGYIFVKADKPFRQREGWGALPFCKFYFREIFFKYNIVSQKLEERTTTFQSKVSAFTCVVGYSSSWATAAAVLPSTSKAVYVTCGRIWKVFTSTAPNHSCDCRMLCYSVSVVKRDRKWAASAVWELSYATCGTRTLRTDIFTVLSADGNKVEEFVRIYISELSWESETKRHRTMLLLFIIVLLFREQNLLRKYFRG